MAWGSSTAPWGVRLGDQEREVDEESPPVFDQKEALKLGELAISSGGSDLHRAVAAEGG